MALIDVIHHSALPGLLLDTHTQYLLADGSRDLGGNWDLGTNDLTNGGAITMAGLGTFNSLEIVSGNITSAAGEIDFDDEDLITLGDLNVGGDLFVVDSAVGAVGIGVDPPSDLAKFILQSTTTRTASGFGIFSNYTLAPASNTSGDFVALGGLINVSNTDANFSGNIIGLQGRVSFSDAFSNTYPTLIGVDGFIDIDVLGGSTIDEIIAVRAALNLDLNFGGTITDAYGVKVEDITEATTGNNWAIKTGLGKVWFGDAIYFTQVDGAERIDSETDARMDYHATTAHDFSIGGTEQIVLTDGKLAPTTDNDIDLGDATHEFKDAWFDGTVNIDSLVADTADINGGTIDGTAIGGGTPAAGAFTTLLASGLTTLNADLLIKNLSGDIATVTMDGTSNNSAEFTYDSSLGLFTFGDSLLASGTLTVGDIFTSGDGGIANFLTISNEGDITFFGTAGFILGHMNIPGVDVTVDTSATANPVEVADDGTVSLGDGWASTYQNGTTFAAADLHYITVDDLGTYKVVWDYSVRTAGGGGTVIHGGVMVDGVAVRNNGESHTHIFNANDDTHISSVAVIDCPNGTEEISLWVSNNANQKTIVEHGNMLIEMVGGT